MGDIELQRDVLEHLSREPSVNAAHIGVTARDGVIALSGHVGSYMEKVAAERAVRRVKGVRAIAEEIEVRLAHQHREDDEEIAAKAARVLKWAVSVPDNDVKVEVSDGKVILRGDVDWQYQRKAAEHAVHQLAGVVAITNAIRVKRKAQSSQVQREIEEAFKRYAQLEALGIKVTSSGGKVTLDGKVSHWHERELAEEAAWATPGVTEVEDRLVVGG